MPAAPLRRAALAGLLVAGFGGAAPAFAAPAVSAETGAPAAGLIVRLKSSPQLHTPQAQRAGTDDAGDAKRLQQALVASGVPAGVRRVPVGLRHLKLDFGRLLPAAEARRLAEALRQQPDVAWAEPDTLEPVLQAAPPTDPLFAQQWALRPNGGTDANAIADRLRGVPGFLSAWQSGVPGATRGAVVAVLDTGVTAHPDLADRLLPGHDFVADSTYANDGDGRDTDPTDPGDWVSDSEAGSGAFGGCRAAPSTWHGTIVTGLLAAGGNDGHGIAGVQWETRVLPVRVAGKCGAALSDILDGMRWAAGLPVWGAPPNRNPARVVNISFGGNSACGAAYQETVDELRAAGVLVVAAAGNGAGTVARPANCRGVVGVAALNRDGFKTTYSNFGSALADHGIATVGGDPHSGAWGGLVGDGGLMAPWNDGTRGAGLPNHAYVFGTSFAAPLVAGTASLMLGVNPALSVDELQQGLRRSARPHVTSPWIQACSAERPGRCLCSADSCGAGILDAEQALRYAVDPAAYVAPARQPAVIDNAEVQTAAAGGADPGPEDPQADADRGDTGGGALDWAALAGAAAALLALAAQRRRSAPLRASAGRARTAR